MSGLSGPVLYDAYAAGFYGVPKKKYRKKMIFERAPLEMTIGMFWRIEMELAA